MSCARAAKAKQAAEGVALEDRDMIIVIQRFDPDKDHKPYMQEFKINLRDVPGIMLLDALEHIKTKDPSLALRRSCGGGICGSDGMNINGMNGLACMTALHSLPKKVTLRPLPSLPIIRDLIVDMSQFYDAYEYAQPWLQAEEPAPQKERIQSEADRKLLDGLYECILCACCSTSCPSWWWNPDKFLGPAALLWAARFLLDSRDTADNERLDRLTDAFKVYRCHNIMNCATVCPKGLNPTKAITQIRTKLLDEST
jgi:succinate dehydrogenase / fumarate reductase iron-sulfur subunit